MNIAERKAARPLSSLTTAAPAVPGYRAPRDPARACRRDHGRWPQRRRRHSSWASRRCRRIARRRCLRRRPRPVTACRRSCSSSACATTPRRAICAVAGAVRGRRRVRVRWRASRATTRSRRAWRAPSPPGPTRPSTSSTGSPACTRAARSSSCTSASRLLGAAAAAPRTPGALPSRPGPTPPYAVAAGNLLYPQYARDLPRFVPGASLPADLGGLDALPRSSRSLRRRAQAGERLATLRTTASRCNASGTSCPLRGCSRAYARRHPADAEAQVAAAVARFDKARPAAGVLAARPAHEALPAAATVRFHLGLLLLWSGEVREAKRQLRSRAASRAGLDRRP